MKPTEELRTNFREIGVKYRFFCDLQEGDWHQKEIVSDGKVFTNPIDIIQYIGNKPDYDPSSSIQLVSVEKGIVQSVYSVDLANNVRLITLEPDGCSRQVGIRYNDESIAFSTNHFQFMKIPGFETIYTNVSELEKYLVDGPQENPGYHASDVVGDVKSLCAYQASEDVRTMNQYFDAWLTTQGLPTDVGKLIERMMAATDDLPGEILGVKLDGSADMKKGGTTMTPYGG